MKLESSNHLLILWHAQSSTLNPPSGCDSSHISHYSLTNRRLAAPSALSHSINQG
jgi:hypothetical protein